MGSANGLRTNVPSHPQITISIHSARAGPSLLRSPGNQFPSSFLVWIHGPHYPCRASPFSSTGSSCRCLPFCSIGTFHPSDVISRSAVAATIASPARNACPRAASETCHDDDRFPARAGLPNRLYRRRRFLHDDVRLRTTTPLETRLADQDFPVDQARLQHASVRVNRRVFRLYPAPFDDLAHHPAASASHRDDCRVRYASPSLHGQDRSNRDSASHHETSASDILDLPPGPSDPDDTTRRNGHGEAFL
jgi:hypothetical protein